MKIPLTAEAKFLELSTNSGLLPHLSLFVVFNDHSSSGIFVDWERIRLLCSGKIFRRMIGKKRHRLLCEILSQIDAMNIEFETDGKWHFIENGPNLTLEQQIDRILEDAL